jgi:peptide/nickel transport system substrate-binding protein
LAAQASFNLLYLSNTPWLDQEMRLLKADFAQAGIRLELSSAPFDTVIGTAAPCGAPSQCTWDMGSWGIGWIYQPDYYPTGEELWSCSGSGASLIFGGSDGGGYCSSQANADILATQTSDVRSAMSTYDDYLAQQLPVVWMPVPDQQLSEINKNLKGASPQSPLFFINPENWRWS